MKLNLPTTWTSQKIVSLFLLTLLQANKVKTGQAFNNCLSSAGDTTSYELLFKYFFTNHSVVNSSQWLILCCDNGLCSPFSPNKIICNRPFSCVKISQTMYCGSYFGSGIVGSTSIITNSSLGTLDKCSESNITTVSNNTLASKLVGLSQGYANYQICSLFTYCIWCNWDNDGWTCHSFLGNSSNSLFYSNNASSNCYLQWPAPWPNETDPYVANSSSISASRSSLSFSPSSNNNFLVEETTIPIGVVGVSSLSGFTYYLIRKRKKKQQVDRERKETESRQDVIAIQKEIILLEKLSQEHKERLLRENEELAEKLRFYDPLQAKEKELEKLKTKYLAKSDYEEREERLDEILRVQTRIVINNDEYFHGEKARIREILIRKAKLTSQEIDAICQSQKEITQLQIDINTQGKRLNQAEINQINNYISVNVQQGDAVIGNQISGNQQNDEIEAMEAKIEIPSKN